MTRHLYDAAMRLRAAELYDAGRGMLSISNQIGVPYEVVRQWVSTYRSVGAEGLTIMGSKVKTVKTRWPLWLVRVGLTSGKGSRS